MQKDEEEGAEAEAEAEVREGLETSKIISMFFKIREIRMKVIVLRKNRSFKRKKSNQIKDSINLNKKKNINNSI